jgi:hypothetical protein
MDATLHQARLAVEAVQLRRSYRRSGLLLEI